MSKYQDFRSNFRNKHAGKENISFNITFFQAFFADTASVQKQFSSAVQSSPLAAQIPKAQLESMAKRLRDIGPKSDVRAVRLKYLEHKARINKEINDANNVIRTVIDGIFNRS